jgi:predicted metal-dependent enzyme (double-stranded beta helix superfamily)
VTWTRRHALQLSAKAVVGLLATAPLTLARAARSDGTIDWDAFLDRLSALAQAQFTPEWDPAAYVEDVAALMKTLAPRDRAFRRFLRRYRDTAQGFPAIRSAHDGGHFSVATLHFEPGEAIGLHDHPRMTGVILGLRGAARIDAFDRLPHPERDDRWRLRPAGPVVVAPGQHATLTPDRGNVHALRADTFTELLDVFTPPYDAERSAEFRWYERAETSDPDGTFPAWERPRGG